MEGGCYDSGGVKCDCIGEEVRDGRDVIRVGRREEKVREFGEGMWVGEGGGVGVKEGEGVEGKDGYGRIKREEGRVRKLGASIGRLTHRDM